jgi:hypothetical protein
LRGIEEAMLQVGTADGRCSFRTECEVFSRPVLEGIHLLFHNISPLAYAANEEVSVLEEGGIKTLVAVKLAGGLGCGLDISPVRLVGRYNITRAAWSLIQSASF